MSALCPHASGAPFLEPWCRRLPNPPPHQRPALLDTMQQAIDNVAAQAAQCGVEEWQRIRKARRAINDLLATIEGRERKASSS